MATGMEKIHTHDEFISRADLVKTAELTLEVIRVAAKSSTKSL
jgi:di/tripeptidase